ncbi:ribonuclease 2B-like [Grammomys surdaster]|uniref:ribonuclease 2B-like n=1 Tax=Grammomys surdaster TaxID=491861 RepID=UPI00109FB856|nr:ribonuclease 2B-like [Grammomys surdaster]
MGLKMLESRLCLLLLLGLVLTLASGQRPTPSEWFKIQHIIRGSRQCNSAMIAVNRYTGRCKDFNSFLHTSFADAVRVCGNPRTTCRNGLSTNCHDSSSRVSVTSCKLTTPSQNFRLCRYQTTGARKFYRVACTNRTPRDSPTYPVVPVHLDRVF